MSGPGEQDARDAARAIGLLESIERTNREDMALARRDAGRCRLMVETLALQLLAGEYVGAAATAHQLSAWARSVGMKLELVTARSVGLRAGREAERTGVTAPPPPPDALP